MSQARRIAISLKKDVHADSYIKEHYEDQKVKKEEQELAQALGQIRTNATRKLNKSRCESKLSKALS